MDMAINSAGGDDKVFTGDCFRGGADDEIGIDAVHRVGVSSFADAHDAAVFDADIGFHDAPMIENNGIGNDEIERAGLPFAKSGAALAHAIANYFSAAEGDFVTVVREVFFDFDEQVGVSESN